MFLRDPIGELQLFRLRERELQEAATRGRLLRSAARRTDNLGRWLLLSLGDLLVALGEKLRAELDEPSEGAAA